MCNVAQSWGRETGQYNAAMTIGSNLPDDFVPVNEATSFDKYTGWTITGHSLGGGLASAAAGVGGDLGTTQLIERRVETFNAARLHGNTVLRFLSPTGINNPPNGLIQTIGARLNQIRAYRTEADPLTRRITPDGEQYWLEDAANASAILPDGHGMNFAIQGLCVDAIGKRLGKNYYIDVDPFPGHGGICYQGNQYTLTTAIDPIDIHDDYPEP